MRQQQNLIPTRGRRYARLFSILAAVVVGLGGWAVWSLWLGAAPPGNGEPAKVARFISSTKFERLNDEERREYIDALRKDKAKLWDAYAKKQISTREYEDLLLNVWISRGLKHSDAFAKLPPGPKREKYLDQIIEYSEKKRLTTTRPADSTIWDKNPYELDSVKKLVASWPAERQAQWDDLRQSLRARQVAKRAKAVTGIWY
jgi:hypothetical protein